MEAETNLLEQTRIKKRDGKFSFTALTDGSLDNNKVICIYCRCERVATGARSVSNTTCWPNTQLMQRALLPTTRRQINTVELTLRKCAVGHYIVSITKECYIQVSMCICCCLLGLSLPCYAFSIFSEQVASLRLFWRIFWTVFVVLHKASIFVHSHDDKSLRNLKNIPLRYI